MSTHCTSSNRIIVSFAILLLTIPLFFLNGTERSPSVILIRPQEKQIENLVELKKQGLLSQEIQVIALYHEGELTDYKPARKYAVSQKISWIRFETIKGGIDLGGSQPGRGVNAWTAQFLTLFNSTDGIIFTGGMDLPPRLYGEEQRLTTEASTPIRSVYEFSFLHHLVGDAESAVSDSAIPFLKKRPEYAVLGICLGCQTLNAAAGGSLIQNIPAQIYGLSTFEDVLRLPKDQIHSARYLAGLNNHIADSLPPALHPVRGNGLGRITPSLLSSGNRHPLVLSSHHQSLGRIGHGLLVTATSMDGRIVEMIEHENFPSVLGVQYHPEVFSLYRTDHLYRRIGEFGESYPRPPASSLGSEWMNQGPIGQNLDFSLNEELKNTDSMPLHRALWNWFSAALNNSREKR